METKIPVKNNPITPSSENPIFFSGRWPSRYRTSIDPFSIFSILVTLNLCRLPKKCNSIIFTFFTGELAREGSSLDNGALSPFWLWKVLIFLAIVCSKLMENLCKLYCPCHQVWKKSPFFSKSGSQRSRTGLIFSKNSWKARRESISFPISYFL